MDVLARIRYYMDLRKWNNYYFAKMIGKSRNTVNDMFRRNTCPTLPTLEAMCDAFEISLSEFFMDGDTAVHLNKSQQDILDVYRALSESNKKLANAYLYGLAQLPLTPNAADETKEDNV